MSADPYRTLGVSPSATDAELRTAYRRLVLRHHPDHNGGSAESTRRFEEVQEAYAEIRRRQRQAAGTGPSAPGGAPRTAADPDLEARLAAMERELQAARTARERAAREARRVQQEARRAAATSSSSRSERPSDEELGIYTTDDSFSKIIDDYTAELSERWSEARRSPAAHRISDLIDELAAKLTGEPPDRR